MTKEDREFLGQIMDYANEVSKQSGLPIVMTTVKSNLYDELKSQIDNLLPLSLQAKPI